MTSSSSSSPLPPPNAPLPPCPSSTSDAQLKRLSPKLSRSSSSGSDTSVDDILSECCPHYVPEDEYGEGTPVSDIFPDPVLLNADSVMERIGRGDRESSGSTLPIPPRRSSCVSGGYRRPSVSSSLRRGSMASTMRRDSLLPASAMTIMEPFPQPIRVETPRPTSDTLPPGTPLPPGSPSTLGEDPFEKESPSSPPTRHHPKPLILSPPAILSSASTSPPHHVPLPPTPSTPSILVFEDEDPTRSGEPEKRISQESFPRLPDEVKLPEEVGLSRAPSAASSNRWVPQEMHESSGASAPASPLTPGPLQPRGAFTPQWGARYPMNLPAPTPTYPSSQRHFSFEDELKGKRGSTDRSSYTYTEKEGKVQVIGGHGYRAQLYLSMGFAIVGLLVFTLSVIIAFTQSSGDDGGEGHKPEDSSRTPAILAGAAVFVVLEAFAVLLFLRRRRMLQQDAGFIVPTSTAEKSF
ncbi:MAG: hypothetical protein DHS80DRAFT_23146 [Piptocephalis tieghemiana]|nr:MAG: hypothetical protein DHS80DRAFT_23146 [Piptocephalis tieghemiana]